MARTPDELDVAIKAAILKQQEAKQEVGRLFDELEESRDECPHTEVVKYAGELTHQKVIECARCGYRIAQGYNIFDGMSREDVLPMSARPSRWRDF